MFQVPPDASEIVPLKAPASRPDAPEIAPSATQSAPAQQNEADLLPALDPGRDKLLSSTESEDALKDCKFARTLARSCPYGRAVIAGCSRCYHARRRTHKATPSPVLALIRNQLDM